MLKKLIACSASIAVSAGLALAEPSRTSEIAPAGAVTTIHRLDDLPSPGKVGLLAHGELSGAATLYELSGGKLVEAAKSVVPDRIWAAATYVSGDRRRIAYVTGYGRKDLGAPIRVHLAGPALDSPETIFERASERGEATFVRQSGDGLVLNFFESKYFTKLGLLEPVPGGTWSFREDLAIRLGTYVDTDGSLFVVGRPYGDVLGQDGDARLLRDGKRELLPTYRGVSAVHFAQVDADSSSEILIGDGWHQDYGKLAQGRLSLLDLDEKSGRYALQIVELDEEQYAFTRISSVRSGEKALVIAGGNRRIRLFDPSNGWSSRILYEHSGGDSLLDFVVLGAEAGKLYVAILDSKLVLGAFEID